MSTPRVAHVKQWGLLACCVVLVLSGAAGYGAVEKTRQKLLDDSATLRDAEAIFPIAHFVIKDKPGQIYKDRLDVAIQLWLVRPRPIWLLAGGGSGGRESGAAVGKRYLIENGIPPDG